MRWGKNDLVKQKLGVGWGGAGSSWPQERGRNEASGALSPSGKHTVFRDAQEQQRWWVYHIHGQGGGGGSTILILPV